MVAQVSPVSPEALERRVLAKIPLASAMQIQVGDYGKGRLVLEAPFAPNVNHAGIAFGGAIECLGTLACWGLLWLMLADPAALIVIQHGETSFRSPLTGTLHAEAHAPDDEVFRRFRGTLRRRGRARIDLSAVIGSAGTNDGARFRGRFAATAHGADR